MLVVNFFADPYAVKELLVSTPLHKGLPRDRFLLLTLDTTTIHELPFPLYKSLVDPAFENSAQPSVASDKSPLVHFTSSFLERVREVMIQFGKDAMELHDIVAVWCAIDNPPFADGEPVNLAPGWEVTTRVFDIERYVIPFEADLSAYFWKELVKLPVECLLLTEEKTTPRHWVQIVLKHKGSPMIPSTGKYQEYLSFPKPLVRRRCCRY